MRIRARLALYGATVTAIAMLGFGILLGILVGQSAPTDQQKDLLAIAEASASGLGDLTVEDVVAAAPLAQVDAATSTDSFVVIADTEGESLYATGVVDGQAVRIPAAVIVEAVELGASTALLNPTSEVELRIHATPWPSGTDQPFGVAVAVQSTAFVDEQVTGLRAVLWITGIITLIAASVVAWLVSGRALKPLQDLVETTDRIGSTGDLSSRLPPKDSRDEVGRLTTSFNAMLAELETAQLRRARSLEAQRQFVADASHELRSPLTTIRNNAGFLLDRPDADAADRNEALADISGETERMTRLVDDLLTLALADSDAPAPRAPTDLSVVLHDAGRRAKRSGLPVAIDAADPGVVLGDAEALARLVWILIDNAAKHGDGDIRVSLSSDDGFASVAVSDMGSGIPADHIEKVFDRFHRVDPARSPAGAGLGLAIAQEIAASHGGTIAAENQPTGTSVRVRIPLAR